MLTRNLAVQLFSECVLHFCYAVIIYALKDNKLPGLQKEEEFIMKCAALQNGTIVEL